MANARSIVVGIVVVAIGGGEDGGCVLGVETRC